MPRYHRSIASACVFAFIGAVEASPTSDDGFDWVTIGSPFNDPFPGGPIGQMAGRGGVTYVYRLTRTEITVAEWGTFLAAYEPFVAYEYLSPFELSGGFFFPVSQPDGTYHFEPPPEEYLSFPMPMSWRAAAVFCNWLSNGRLLNQAAFENGAYDITTFTFGPDGVNDQSSHTPGAAYWIPTLDEWMKGAYYDPAQGEDQPGWWSYPNSSDVPLVIGPPGEGETNASLFNGRYPYSVYYVGSYPEVTSPWGLLDLSGGWSEHTEEWHFDPGGRFRSTKGSAFWHDRFGVAPEDSIMSTGGEFPGTWGCSGLRLASAPYTVAGDLDCDGDIDGADLAILLGAWGRDSGGVGDLDGNGAVDAADLGLLLGVWGAWSACPSGPAVGRDDERRSEATPGERVVMGEALTSRSGR